MLRTSQLIVTGIAAAYASIVSAVCPYPAAINVPNGTTATTDDMVNGQALVKQYMAEMETYLTCLENEEAELSKTIAPFEPDRCASTFNPTPFAKLVVSWVNPST